MKEDKKTSKDTGKKATKKSGKKSAQRSAGDSLGEVLMGVCQFIPGVSVSVEKKDKIEKSQKGRSTKT